MFLFGIALSMLMVQEPTIPPSTLTFTKPDATLSELLDAVEQQTRIEVRTQATANPINVDFRGTPFWTALQSIADKTGTRIVLRNQGETIQLLEQGQGKTLANVVGPFRIVVDEIVSRLDFSTGQQTTDIALTIHWEPTFPIFRISTEPLLDSVKLDSGTTLKVEPTRTRTATRGYAYTTRVTLPDIPRGAQTVETLSGQFRVTSAKRMIMAPLRTLSSATETIVTDSGVTVTFKPARQIDGLWEFRIIADYPKGMPTFESFESWVTKNRFTLVSPTGERVESTDWDIPEQSERIVGVYRFPTKVLPRLNGWSAIYTTPTPLIEFDVPFTLTAIPLP